MNKFRLVSIESMAAVVFASALVLSVSGSLLAEPKAKVPGHDYLWGQLMPRPSYVGVKDIDAMAEAVRKSRPVMLRGGWEWDKLYFRYVDGGRKDKGALKILHAYFMSIMDRYYEAEKTGKGDKFNLLHGHGAWGFGGRMRIYLELVRQKKLTPKQQATFKQIVDQSIKMSFDYPNRERGMNNRAVGTTGGPAIAVRTFPDMKNAPEFRRWLKAIWRELDEYGDTTETTYNPYGPLFLIGLLDLADGMGKLLGDPWSFGHYYADSVDDGQTWYRFAREFKDPEFLWVSEQTCLGGRPPKGHRMPPEYMKAYKQRYAWFVANGIEPKVPAGGAKIGYHSPLKYKVPERLYLCPSRESGKPFVSFYLYDRNNNYMHCCGDGQGRLYEYCIDGAKFLHSSAKYTSGRGGIGPVGFDQLLVLPPDMDFPVKKNGRMGGNKDAWKTASLSLPFTLNCRLGPDSKNWFTPRKKRVGHPGNFHRTDEPDMGFAYGNMDGYWYLNNEFHLKSVSMGRHQEFSEPAIIQNLRLGGPKGEIILAAFDSIPKNLKVILHKDKVSRVLSGDERKKALTIVNEGKNGPSAGSGQAGRALRLNVEPKTRLELTLEGLDLKFDAQDEYTRVSFDCKGEVDGWWGWGPDIYLNGRIRPIYHTSLYNQGGILIRDSLRAETHPSTTSTSSGQAGSGQGDKDTFGQFAYRNFFGAHSTWTRQTVLTTEGYLIVRDLYEPGNGVDGYHASPNWLLPAGQGDTKDPIRNVQAGRNWFDAPARSYAWWQKKKKRVLLYLHPGKGLTCGQARTRHITDIGSCDSSFAKAILKAGKPQVWLSVLVPFNEGEDATKVAKKIKTSVDRAGNCTAGIGNTKVTINAHGKWSVKR